MLHIRSFSQLTADELYEILRARAAVFLMKQGIVYVDADEVDRRALHIFRRDERDVVSYARLFPETDEGMVHMGRVLTTKRGKGFGREVVEGALSVAFDRMEAQCVRIDSQVHVAPFYAHLGFRQTSDVFVLEGVEHVKMELSAAAYGTQASRLRLTSNNSDGETAGGTPASHAPAAAYGTQAARLRLTSNNSDGETAGGTPAPHAPAAAYGTQASHLRLTSNNSDGETAGGTPASHAPAAAYGTQAARLRLTSNNSDGETAGGTPASHAPAAAYGTQAARLRLKSNNSDGETAGGTPASHAPAAAYGTQAARLRQSDSHPAPFAPAPPYDDVWLHFNPASPYPYSYKYPRASVTADCILFSKKEAQLHVLLIRRGAPPYEDHWAFPGGFLEVGKEDTEQCARRELQEETGLTAAELNLVGVFSRPGRDPRCPVVTAAYCGLVPYTPATGSDDAAEARWFPVEAIPPLAFDHDEMLRTALTLITNPRNLL